MLLAVASRLSGIPVSVALSNLLGVLMCGVAAAAVWLLWGEISEQPSNPEMILAAILFSGPWFFTVWFIFGMETGLAVLSILGFLLWLAKLHAGAPRFPWLLVGILATSALAITRLESSIYIACGILISLATARWKRVVPDLAIVAALSGATEIAWLLYAKRAFGTYMPWSSTGRLFYYLPGNFGLASAAQFYSLGLVGRTIVALKAAAGIVFGGPLKILLVLIPFCAAAFFLRSRDKSASMKWMLRVALISMAVEIVAFAYLFPLFKLRHMAPYIAGIWVFVSPAIARAVSRVGRTAGTAAIVCVTALWAGGAVQYRHQGAGLAPLHQLAASGTLLPTDTLAAEPIGILSFETQTRIVDLGGLTDRSPWPMLRQADHTNLGDVVAWETGKGANKLLVLASDCGTQGRDFGFYCLIDASAAQAIVAQQQAKSGR
jgi:hypothetical protein